MDPMSLSPTSRIFSPLIDIRLSPSNALRTELYRFREDALGHPIVEGAIHDVAGTLPDFIALEEAGVLHFEYLRSCGFGSILKDAVTSV